MNELIKQATLLMFADAARETSQMDDFDTLSDDNACYHADQSEDDTPLFI